MEPATVCLALTGIGAAASVGLGVWSWRRLPRAARMPTGLHFGALDLRAPPLVAALPWAGLVLVLGLTFASFAGAARVEVADESDGDPRAVVEVEAEEAGMVWAWPIATGVAAGTLLFLHAVVAVAADRSLHDPRVEGFLADHCSRGLGDSSHAAVVERYRAWAGATGHRPVPPEALAEALATAGYREIAPGTGSHRWLNLRVSPPP